MPNNLTGAQKAERAPVSRGLLESLRLHQHIAFKDPATGDESWVCHKYQQTSMYVSSHNEVPSIVKNTIGT
jgi:hypothetical protein